MPAINGKKPNWDQVPLFGVAPRRLRVMDGSSVMAALVFGILRAAALEPWLPRFAGVDFIGLALGLVRGATLGGSLGSRFPGCVAFNKTATGEAPLPLLTTTQPLNVALLLLFALSPFSAALPRAHLRPVVLCCRSQ